MKSSKILLLVLSAGLLVSCGGDNNSTTSTSSSSSDTPVSSSSSSSDSPVTSSSSSSQSTSESISSSSASESTSESSTESISGESSESIPSSESSTESESSESISASESSSEESESSESSTTTEPASLDEALLAVGQAYYNVMTNDKIGFGLETDSLSIKQAIGTYTESIINFTNVAIDAKVEGLTSGNPNDVMAEATASSLAAEVLYNSSNQSISSDISLTNANAYMSNSMLYFDLSYGDNLANFNHFMTQMGAPEGYFATGKIIAGSFSFPTPLFPSVDPLDGTAYDATGEKLATFLNAYLTQYNLKDTIEKYVDVTKDGEAINLAISFANIDELVDFAADVTNAQSTTPVDKTTIYDSLNQGIREFNGLSIDLTITNGYLTDLSLDLSVTDFLMNNGSSYTVEGETHYITSYDHEFASTLSINGGLDFSFNYGNSVTLPSDLDTYVSYIGGDSSSSEALG